MGVDIRWHVERRGDDGIWSRAEPLVPTTLSRGPRLVRWRAISKRDPFLRDLLRDGEVEGVAAGIPVGRGLPADVSAETRDEFIDANVDNCSWLSLRELFSFDWGQQQAARATVHDNYPDGRKGRAAVIQEESREQLRLCRGFFPEPIAVSPGMPWLGDEKVIHWRESVLQSRDEVAHCLVLMATWCKGDLDAVRAIYWFEG